MLRRLCWASAASVLLFSSCVYGQREEAGAAAQRLTGQIPEFRELADSTDALQRQIDANAGGVNLTEARYRLTRPLVIDLRKQQAFKVTSDRGCTLIMDGPGPAIRLVGSHQGTASPKSFQPATWNERMPLVSGIEIVGAHDQADGIELNQTVGAVIEKCSVRWCRHGIHLVERNRNVVISDVHLYENSGVGLYLDDVNLHQINVTGSHVSYNRAGGIVVRDGNVRNLQVSGCDLEANMPADETKTSAANVWIDLSGSADDASTSVAEVSITGCTIQHSANYSGHESRTVAPGGANVRLAGKAIYPINSVTITGNVISDTTTGIDIRHAHDVAISANNFFAPKPSHLIIADSQRVVVQGNSFNPRQFVRPGVIRFERCEDCILADSTVHASKDERGAIQIENSAGMMITGVRVSQCAAGIWMRNSRDSSIVGCRISDSDEGGLDFNIDASNQQILLSANATGGEIAVDDAAVSP